MFDNIFTSSTPETRPDWCDSVGTWRVAHRDLLETALVPIADSDVYVTHVGNTRSGAKRLYVGYRNNTDTDAHSARTESLFQLLRSNGLSVRAEKWDGSIRGIIVTDKG